MKTICILAIALCGALAGSSPLLLAGQTANGQAAGVNSTKAAETDNTPSAAARAESVAATKAPRLSWGLDDVVKLSKAGVDESVIHSYILNSGVGYNPTAQDIIQLRELGVSSQITAALMQRGSEVRQTATVEAQKQAQAAAAPAQAAPVYAAPATYVAPASTVTYIGYPSYAYSYGGYYGPSYYSYPYYYGGFYPSVSVGFRFGGGHFSGHSGGFHGGFPSHGGFSGGFHGASHGGFHGGGHHR